jgi:pimeloyl-ACP methyl ester carboxylesterase
MAWLFTDFGRMIGLCAAAQAALEDEVYAVTGRRLADFDAAKAAGGLAQQILVIHAEDDKEVSASHARRYAASGDNLRLFWANRFGHRRIVSAEPVLAEIRSFLDDSSPNTDADIIPVFEIPARRASC